MPPSDDPELVRRTQRIDIARSVPLGILLPLESSVLLTIAIKEFDAAWWVKWMVAAANGVGLLATPMITSVARRSGRPVMLLASALAALGSVGYLLATLGGLPGFVLGSVIGVATVNVIYPLMTVTYERNFPQGELGRRVGWGLSMKVAVSVAAGLLMGACLTRWPDQWWLVVVLGAMASALLAFLQLRMPSEPLARVPGVRNTALPHFHLLATDRRLRLTLSAWMLMGFGNLMLLPLRVEFLARPQYGIDASADRIVVLTVVVPSMVRLLSMPVFGAVFDRMRFFTGTSTAGLLVGAVVLGIASAGGDLMWSLWVTKFAPAGRTADYMGLHTFFTGIRAVLAPLAGFAIVGHVSLGWVAVVAAGFMVASSLVLVPEARAERALRQEDPVSV